MEVGIRAELGSVEMRMLVSLPVSPARGLLTKPRSAQGRTSSIARHPANARGSVDGRPVLHACRDRRAMIAVIISAPLRSIAVRLA
jgi:hypothetical protein